MKTQHYLIKASRGRFLTESVIVEALMNPKRLPPETVKHSLIAAHRHELGLVFLLLKYVRPDVLEQLAKLKGIKVEYEDAGVEK